MAKSNKNKNGKRRAVNRPSRRRTRHRVAASPPLINFNKTLMNTVIRASSTKGIQESNLETLIYSVNNLISGYPQLVSTFKEIKIKRVNVWTMSTCSTAASGSITMLVAPTAEVNSTETWDQLTVTPGASTKRIWQTVRGVYYPTEPDERNWMPISSKKPMFTVLLMVKDIPADNSVSSKCEVQVITDVHVVVRGRAAVKAGNPSHIAESIVDEDSSPHDIEPPDDGFAHLSMDANP